MKAIPGRSSGFLVMISYILGTYLYGEPYSTSSNTVVYPGYTGRYTMVLLVSLVVYYSLWIGVQLPQGRYVSYSRGYILVSLGCNIGYTPVPLPPYLPVPLYSPLFPASIPPPSSSTLTGVGSLQGKVRDSKVEYDWEGWL